MADFDIARAGLKDIYDILRGVRQASASSITEATKDTQINAPVFIQNKVANDDIAPVLISVINQMYAAMIMTAVGLNRYVSGNRTMRDVVRTVSTESLMEPLDVVEQMFGKNTVPSMEANTKIQLNDKEKRLMSSKLIALDINLNARKDNFNQDDDDRGVSLTGRHADNTSSAIYITCTLLPRIMPSDVVRSTIMLNYRPRIGDRWTQFSAGEIAFWKDFILCQDILEAERKGFRKDKTGILYEIATAKHNRFSLQLAELILFGGFRNNIASTIFICDKSTVNSVSTKTNFNWDNYRDRQKFFFETSSMMMVMVDPMYNLVDVYFNGIKSKAEYTFDLLDRFENGKKDVEMFKVMSQLSQGQAPNRI